MTDGVDVGVSVTDGVDVDVGVNVGVDVGVNVCSPCFRINGRYANAVAAGSCGREARAAMLGSRRLGRVSTRTMIALPSNREMRRL